MSIDKLYCAILRVMLDEGKAQLTSLKGKVEAESSIFKAPNCHIILVRHISVWPRGINTNVYQVTICTHLQLHSLNGQYGSSFVLVLHQSRSVSVVLILCNSYLSSEMNARCYL